MNTKIIFFKATDGVDLKGIIYKSEKTTSKILISIHGMATNCLKQRDEIIAKKISEIDIDFLTFNNRGHDLINYIKKQDNDKSELAGTSYEEISECYNDILGAINYAIELGYEEIYLMGHSLGATKTIYAYNKLLEEKSELVNKVKGIILLSLVDIPLAIQVYLQEKFTSMITYAKNMKKEGLENELMPEKSFIHPISIKTFLRYSIDNKDIDFSRFSDSKYEFKELNNIKIPLFMRWGNIRELIIQKPEELCDLLKNKIQNKNLDINFIDGADHSYREKEEILAKQIKNFINKY